MRTPRRPLRKQGLLPQSQPPRLTSFSSRFRAAARRRHVPAAAAIVAGPDSILAASLHGHQVCVSHTPLTLDSIFRVFSMTKPVTSVAALQLVEQGKLDLDEPAARHLPELAAVEVLEGFHPATGSPILRPPRSPVTARHLLSHTAGFGYEFWHPEIHAFAAQTGRGGLTSLRAGDLASPLLFDPGQRWQYGINTDWLGKLVEAVSGLSLGDYFRTRIFDTLCMADTAFHVSPASLPRLVSTHQRQPDGSLLETPPALPAPRYESGGGGLMSTARDYIRFLQVFLRSGAPLLSPESFSLMASNQIGAASAGVLSPVLTQWTGAVDFRPGIEHKFGFGFLINLTPYPTGRSAHTLAWAGLANTYFWIDPSRNLCAVLLTQIFPFFDPAPIALLHDLERLVYSNP